MYLNSCIPWVNNKELFENSINLAYKLGYQAVFVDIRSKKDFDLFKNSEYCVKHPNIIFPLQISSLKAYCCQKFPIPLFPRITLSPKSPNALKQDLSSWIQLKCLIAVESTDKNVLEVAARDGRVDILSIKDLNHCKALTKGILSLARQNKCSLDLSLSLFFEGDYFYRPKIFRTLYRLFLSAKPFSNKYIIGNNSSSLYDMRGPKETIAVLHSLLKIPEEFAKNMISKNLEDLALLYIKRDQELFIEPDVEIVDIKKNKEDTSS